MIDQYCSVSEQTGGVRLNPPTSIATDLGEYMQAFGSLQNTTTNVSNSEMFFGQGVASVASTAQQAPCP